jgi:hypothetical protein
MVSILYGRWMIAGGVNSRIGPKSDVVDGRAAGALRTHNKTPPQDESALFGTAQFVVGLCRDQKGRAMLNVSGERSENALAFQRELIAVVDKWISRVEASEADAFIKELLGYYRIRRMLADSVDRVEFARRYHRTARGGRDSASAAIASTEMTDLSSKTAALIAAASTGATLARIASDKARLLASQK